MIELSLSGRVYLWYRSKAIFLETTILIPDLSVVLSE